MLVWIEILISTISKEVIKRLPQIIVASSLAVKSRELYIKRLNELSREREYEGFRVVVIEMIIESKDWHKKQLKDFEDLMTEDTKEYYTRVAEEINQQLLDPKVLYIEHKKKIILENYGDFLTTEQIRELKNE